jgi:hypothetical protein
MQRKITSHLLRMAVTFKEKENNKYWGGCRETEPS